jgi:pimeloyl-ACP methyl ester carboxylesterase
VRVSAFASASAFTLACAAGGQPPTPPGPTQVDYTTAIRPGDVMVLVPGTGALDYLGTPIEAIGGDDPIVDVRENATVAGDAVVFEQAIAAMHEAGISAAQLEAGAIPFVIWGCGFTTVTQFEYVSYEGIQIHIDVLGGQNSCATGSILTNLVNYTTANATADSTDLFTRTRAYLAANPSTTGAPRHVIVASHSWGGAVAEWLQFNLPQYEQSIGTLADAGGTAPMALTLADGVPELILDHPMAGPGTETMTEGLLYEVDRPDDPVHVLNPNGNGSGHMYNILYGSDFQGSYGITTEELSCGDVPGECSP